MGDLVATLRLDTAQFMAGFREAFAQARTAGSGIEGSLTGAQNAARGVGAAANDAAGGIGNFGRQAAEAGQSTTGLGSATGLAGKALAGLSGLFAGAKLVSYVTDSINAASDLNETVSKSQQIFGSSAATVQAWGETAATAVGLSKSAALDAATNFGNVFTQIGFTSKAAADLSTKTVQMAADLGSFNNLPTADVADKISGAFNGEYDSLQALIPGINAARVQSEALAETGKTNAAALTAQEKATAVLTIVQKDGATAMGDFARTSDGFANSQKTLSARFEDQKVALGDKLLPVAQLFLKLLTDVGLPILGSFGAALGAVGQFAGPLIEILGNVIKYVSELPTPVLVAVAAFTAVTLLSGPIAGLGVAVLGLGARATAAGVAIKAAFLGNPIGLAIVAITTALSFFIGGTDDAAAATDAWNGKMQDLKGTLDQVTGAATEASRVKIADQIGTDTLNAWTQLGLNTKTAIDAITQVPGAADATTAAIQSMAQTAVESSDYFKQFGTQLAAAGVSSDDLSRALLNNDFGVINDKILTYNQGLTDTSQSMYLLNDATSEGGTALAGLTGATSGLSDAYHQINGESGLLVAAQGDLATQNAAVKGSAADVAAAVKGQSGATKDAVKPAQDLSAAVKDEDQANKDLETSVRNAIQALDDMQHRNDPKPVQDASAAVRDYAKAYREQQAAAEGIAAAQDAVTEANLKLTDAQSKQVEGSYTQEQKTLDIAAAQRTVNDTSRAVQDAFDHVSESGVALTASGEDVRAKFVEQATEAYNAAAAAGNLGGAHEAAKAKVDSLTAGLRSQLVQSGLTDAQADAYIKTLDLIPDNVATSIDLNGSAEAAKVADDLKIKLDKLKETITIQIKATYTGTTYGGSVGKAIDNATAQLGRADGGAVFGAGTGTSDSIPALLSNGEHVWPAREVQALGGQGAMYALRRNVLGLADGGAVELRLPQLVGAAVSSSGMGGQRIVNIYNDVTLNVTAASGEVVPEALARAMDEYYRTRTYG